MSLVEDAYVIGPIGRALEEQSDVPAGPALPSPEGPWSWLQLTVSLSEDALPVPDDDFVGLSDGHTIVEGANVPVDRGQVTAGTGVVIVLGLVVRAGADLAAVGGHQIGAEPSIRAPAGRPQGDRERLG